MTVNPNPKPLLKPSLIRALHEARGLTREQLAVRAGISSSTLYLVERAGLLSPATAEKVAAVLGVPATELRP
jgi:transcriptional regulator with XRE-family HTH domain